MKIAIVLEIFLPTVNGIITSSINLAENLIAQGHEVIFITPAWEAWDRSIRVGSVPVFYIQSSNNRSYPGMRNVLPWNRRVAAILQREQVDVVHITGPWLLTLACIRAARRQGIPVVHTFHTMLHEPAYILYMFRTPLLVPVLQAVAWWYYSFFVRPAAVNTGPSQMVCDQLQEHFPAADIRRISNGVDTERFAAFPSFEEVQRRVPEFNHKTLIYVGRIGPEKSVDELVHAMALVRRRDPEIRLILVGDGPGAERYRELADNLGLNDTVRFLGRIPHEELVSSGLVQHARAFVTASTTENQPMTVIEAICCDRPALVPDVPGIRELVESNGVLFQPHVPQSIADAIIRICTDEQLYQSCLKATAQMKVRFDGSSVARQFLAVYREVQNSGRLQPPPGTSLG